MKKMKPYQKYWIIGVLLLCTSFSFTYQHLQAQTPGQVEQAKAKLSTMTPDEIEAAIKSYGLTRAEADAKAKEAGIDLESYLKGRSAKATPAAQPQTQVNIQVSPTQVNPNANAGQPAAVTPTVPIVSAPNFDTTKNAVQTTVAPVPIVQAPVVQTPVVQAPEPTKPPQEAAPVKGPEDIPYFGYNLFKAGPSAFEPRPNLADNSYIVGEGDVLRISLWGDTQSMAEYTVDVEGRILIQPAGPVLVAGYTFDQAKARVIRALSQSLAGLAAKPPSTFLDLTIARLRPVRAFIMGEVANPGTYSLSSFATVFNSLFTVGGPLLSGGMREVRLVRSGKIAAKVDLYDYLIGSEKTSDVRVNDNDIIYVPLRGRTVGIKGAVLRKAYFELLPNEQLKRLIEFSGGIRNTFYLQRIQVDRIVPFAERKKGEPDRKVFDINFEDLMKNNKDYKLEDGDIITVFPILDEKKNFVILDGAVWRPGTYQLEKISMLKDLIDAADGLLPEAYLDRADVTRTYDDKHIEAINVNIGLALQGNPAHNIALQPRDRVRIYSKNEMNPLRSVTISGHVKNPGTYPYAEKMTLRDLLFTAGGLEDSLFRANTFMERAYISRLNSDERTRSIITFDLGALWDKDEGNMLLKQDDEVHIYSFQEMTAVDRTVTVTGKAKHPGTYQLQTNLTLYDLVYDAVGLADSVFRQQVYLDRASIVRTNDDLRTTTIIPFDLGKLWETREGDMLLKPRDELRIFSWDEMRENNGTVEISGMVKRPGIFPRRTNQTLFDIVFDNVGLTDTLFRKDVLLETADLIRLNNNGFTTRIVPFNLWKLFTNKEGDTLLLPSDHIVIYPRTAIEERERYVDIYGSVKKPGHYTLEENMTLIDLLLQAGGYTEDAYAVQAEIARITRTGLGKDSLVHTRFAKLPELFGTYALTAQDIAALRLKYTPLQHRDQVFIRPNPAFVFQQFVTVEGEVQFPGKYALNRINERISHVIARAGGVKPNGYLRGGKMLRDGTQLRTNIENAVEDDEGPEDLVLKPGDVITIPKKMGTVTITGNVNNPGIFGYAEGKSLSYYIDAAGDTKDSTDYAVVTYPEGISKEADFGWFSKDPKIPDGSTIFVYKVPPPPPELPDTTGKRTTTYDFVKDVLALVVSSLTVIVLATKL
jgi:polysaccharide export outer membrane protein